MAEANVYAVEGVLRVENPLGAQVTVFGVAGEALYVNASGEQALVVEGLTSGTYVVTVGNEVFKVLL